jgi:hypothetical protein
MNIFRYESYKKMFFMPNFVEISKSISGRFYLVSLGAILTYAAILNIGWPMAEWLVVLGLLCIWCSLFFWGMELLRKQKIPQSKSLWEND